MTFSELVLSSADGSRVKKYHLTSENVYERNRMIVALIDDFTDNHAGTPTFEVYDFAFSPR